MNGDLRKRAGSFLKIAVLILGMVPGGPGLRLYAAEPKLTEVPKERFGPVLSIQEALQRTLKSEAELERARARLGKEEAHYRKSRAEFLPKLTGDAFQAVSTGDVRSVTYLGVTFDQPIFQGGKIMAAKRRHESRLERAKLAFEETRLDVMFRVRILFIRVLELKELVRVSQARVRELSSEYEKTKHLTEKEILLPYEFFRIQTRLERAKRELVRHKEAYDYELDRLRSFVGMNDEEGLDPEPFWDVPDLQDSAGWYIEKSRKNSPVYKIRELKIREKTFERRELWAEYFPQVSLSAKWERDRDLDWDRDRVMAGVSGKWNIWDFGRLGARVRAKSHELDEVKWASKVDIRRHELRILKLYHEARRAWQNIRLSEATLLECGERFKNERIRGVVGESGAREQLDAFLELEEARTGQIEAVAEYRILLEKLTRMTASVQEEASLAVKSWMKG